MYVYSYFKYATYFYLPLFLFTFSLIRKLVKIDFLEKVTLRSHFPFDIEEM